MTTYVQTSFVHMTRSGSTPFFELSEVVAMHPLKLRAPASIRQVTIPVEESDGKINDARESKKDEELRSVLNLA